MRPTALLLAVTLLSPQAIGQEIVASSFVGQRGDTVVAVAIHPRGALLVAANVSRGPFQPDAGTGVIARLSADGSRLESKMAVPGHVQDMAVDGRGHVYVACSNGVVKLDPENGETLWYKDLGRVCNRIDAGEDGHCAVLAYEYPEEDTSTGAGRIYVFDPAGDTLGDFPGQHYTIDVCLDSASRSVIYLGFRNARAWEGKRIFPVQIAYVVGRSYSGDEKYRLYDWSTDRDAADFLNRPTNNMADTRGYRCAIGRDGRLYCAFECAGGNHIFRWEPRLVDGQWAPAGAKKPKADKYHAFYNSRAEHKTFMACYDPASGEYLRGQEFCARLSSGRANAVRVKQGAIAAAADGSVLLSGAASASLPATLLPPGTGDYQGGGFVLMMQPDLSGRWFCARILPGSAVPAVAVGEAEGRQILIAGGTIGDTAQDALYTRDAIQPDGSPGAGFFTVFRLR